MSSQPPTTIGVDIGDRYSHLRLIDTETGEVVEESRIATNPAAFERRFAGSAPARIAIEAGTHSPWISRLLEEHGHQVLVANARKLRLIYGEGKRPIGWTRRTSPAWPGSTRSCWLRCGTVARPPRRTWP